MNQKNLFEEVDFNPFSQIEIEKVVSPIDPQKEIWISCILGGEDANRAYNESITVKFSGQMDTDALLTAMEEVIHRHEALRTTFGADGKTICIHDGLMPEFLLEDLSGYSRKIIDDHIQSFIKKNALIPFDLLNGPLIRVAMFKLSESEHHLVFTAHHVICDGWSFGIIMRELSELYTAYVTGSQPNLPSPYDFSQYAEDSRIFTSSQDYAEIEQYWLNQFQTIPPLLELPHDWPVPEARTFKSSRGDFELDASMVKAVKDLGAIANASFISTLIVAFETYFYKKSGQNDIVIGLPTAGQAATGNFNLVGHCVNVLPIRSNPKSSLSFIEYLKERSLALSSNYDHQQLTFGSLIKKLNMKRDISRVPLIPFVLNIDMGLDAQLEFEGLTYLLETNPREFETFEIFLNISGTGGRLKFEWSYNAQLFREETIGEMMDDLTGILQQVIDNPNTKIGDITLPSNKILEQMELWNQTQIDFPLDRRFTDFISETASRYPEKAAIEFADRTITYAELEEKSNSVAAYLAERSVGREDIVGVHMQRSPEMVMLLLGITKAGAAYLPLDPEYPRDRIEYMLRDSKAKLLIADMGLEANFGAQAEEITAEEIWGQLRPGAEMPPQPGSTGGDLAYVLYTSGSTGNPKGVQIEHRNLTNFLLSLKIAPGIDADDRVLAITTISFDISGLELFLPLIAGATIVLADTPTARDGRLLLQWMEEKDITYLQATPATWRMLMAVGWDKPLPIKALCGGEALPVDLAEKLLENCQSVWNVYGPTETTIWSTVKELGKDDPVLTIGRPIHNTQVYLLDDDRNPLPQGRVGEIYIGGGGVARGYLGRPDLTSERFFDNPFTKTTGDRIYQTGDLGRFLKDGEIVCMGRVDHQVKIRGHRIELGEIEQAIVKIDGVKEAVVIAREDTPGNQRLAAYLLLQGQTGAAPVSEPTKEQVQEWKREVQKSLPPYMIPNDWVVLERFPLTSNNKVDRKMLPKPVTLSADDRMNEELPSTKEQKLVANIWGKILGVNNIKLKDDFFELGGHSLIAVEVMAQIENDIGLKLPLTSLFQHSTLEDFSRLLDNKGGTDEESSGVSSTEVEAVVMDVNQENSRPSSSIEAREISHPQPSFNEEMVSKKYKPIAVEAPDEVDGDKIVTSIEPQQEIWVSCAIGGEDANLSYNQSFSVELIGKLDKDILEFSVRETVKRHEALRSTFSSNGKFITISKDVNPDFVYQDLGSRSDEEKNSYKAQYLNEDVSVPFDLQTGPLIRFALFKMKEGEHILTFTVHHIVCDGWSVGVIVKDISQIYSSLLKEGSFALPKPFSFSEYVKQYKSFVLSDRNKEIEEYWLDQFKGEIPVLDLPTDWPRPESRTYKSHRADFILDLDVSKPIKGLSGRLKTSLARVLTTIVEVYLHKITGQEDIVIGFPTAGQAATGNFDLVGHCVNVLPIRSSPNGALAFNNYLNERGIALSNDYDHQQLTFGGLLKKLNVPRDASRIPLIPFMLTIDIGLEAGINFEGLSHQLVTNPREFEAFEIFLNITGEGGQLEFQWSYNTQLFREETIREMMDDLRGILRQVVDNPAIRIGDITLPSNKILEKLKVWNNTEWDYPKNTPFTKIVHGIAEQYPSKPAVEFFDKTISYLELDEKSNQLAAYLIEKGIQIEDVIGVCLDRSAEMMIVLLGILKAGAAYLPLDPEYPKGRITYMLENSKAPLLITNDRLKGQFDEGIDEETVEVIWDKLKDYPLQYPEINITGSSLAYILYTSGSTGDPKGVQIEHRNIMNLLLSMQASLDTQACERILAITTISFDIAGVELFLPLISGATMILADSTTARDGRLLLQLMEEKGITYMQATPATWRMLMSVGWNKRLPLKTLSCGEPLPYDLAQKLLKNSESVWNGYGPTETTIYSTAKELHENDPVLTIGRPINNTQIYLLDKDRNPVPQGRVGEIYIGGDGVARGYLGRPDLTSERFFDNPFSEVPGARIYRTGDLGKFLDDGEIVCLGRVDHQVKIRGQRIELGEIEQTLVKIAGIKEAVVIAREDPPGNQRLAAYLLLQGQTETTPVSEPTKEQIVEWKEEVQKSLPTYMIPNDWVVLKNFPLTSNTKVDRKLLPKPLTLSAGNGNGTNGQLPVTKGQNLVAEIWTKVLGVNNLGLKDDFFDLGGHSLLAVEVMTDLERKTGKRIPLNSLFRYSNLEEFAQLFEEEDHPGKEGSWSCLVPIKPAGSKPPVYLVHGAGSYVATFFVLAKKVDHDQPVYGLQAKGLNGVDKPFTTLEEMASHYINEIISHNPHGPYYIGGQSFGGYVAYEMARQMKQMNKEVEKLLLFDIDAYQSEIELSNWQKQGRKVIHEFQKRYMDIKLLFNHTDTFIRLKKSSMERKRMKLARILKGNKNVEDTEIAYIIEKIRKVNHRAMDNYLISPYGGDIYLFKAKIQGFYIKEKHNYGWRPYVNNIHVVDVEGDHNSMFEEPLVEELGKKVQTVLNC